jgi:capsular polysaccharide biosynthesis protein
VDFWDLTKLLFRRWKISLPLLLISIGATAWVASTMKPDYSATGHVQMVPPVVTPDTADQLGHARNPWADLGPDALGEAVMITVRRDDVLKSLDRKGLSDTFTVTMDGRSPIITIEVVAKTPAQATGTVVEIAKLLDQAVVDQQATRRTPKNESITTLTLDAGDNVERVTSKLKRALIVVAGVGLLLTAAITIGIDALLRNRARRRAASGRAKVAPAVGKPPRSTADMEQETYRLRLPTASIGSPRTFRSRSLSDDVEESDTEHTQPVRIAGLSIPPVTNGSTDSGSVINRVMARDQKATDQAEADADAATPETNTSDTMPVPENHGMPDDATIVLPIPHKDWAAQENEGKRI